MTKQTHEAPAPEFTRDDAELLQLAETWRARVDAFRAHPDATPLAFAIVREAGLDAILSRAWFQSARRVAPLLDAMHAAVTPARDAR